MTKSTLPIAATAFIAVGASVWLACGSSSFSGAGVDAGQSVPTDCDANADPKDSPACVDDSIGIFVSAAGDDTHAGTKDAPLRTIKVALSKADSQHDRIYLCTGTYAETVKLTGPVSIYGGYSCADWSYAGTAGGTAPKIAPTSPGYALDVESVGKPTTIEDVELDAKSGQNTGDSSIAVFVANSPGPITFRRVAATAGDGMSGLVAAPTSNYNSATVLSERQSGERQHGRGRKELPRRMLEFHWIGGREGGDINMGGQSGGPAIPANLAGHDGAGGPGPGGPNCDTGPPHPGADAVAAPGGAAGAVSAGALSASGWQVAPAGSAGATGGPGQGGGGGAGLPSGSVAGGGGGCCGGCGGAGGNGGSTGGSSFAILIFQSTATVDSCILQAGNGADGQPGADGQQGETGGAGGPPTGGIMTGCFGGNGGNGGNGAGGGGGAGGNAIAIAYVGTQPSLIGGTQIEGHAGAPGGGGKGGSSNDGAAGAAGTKSDITSLP